MARIAVAASKDVVGCIGRQSDYIVLHGDSAVAASKVDIVVDGFASNRIVSMAISGRGCIKGRPISPIESCTEKTFRMAVCRGSSKG